MQNANINEITFEQVSSDWLLFKKNKIKESTYLNYKFIIQTRFLRVLGNKTLEQLLKYNFNDFIQNLNKNLSNKTVKDNVSILKSILRYAEAKYDINFKLNLVSSPSLEKKDIEIFSEKDRKKLEKRCLKSDDIKHLGILISLYTGLRIGEICALKWKDIDFENRILSITHTLQRVYVGRKNTKIIYTTPKTHKSIRKIPLAKLLYDKLKEVSKNYSENDFILTGREDTWVEPLGYRYTYILMLKKCKIRYKNYHVLRHTFATRCIKVGMDTKSLSEILGHASVDITLNIYVHSSMETKQRYINKL